MIDQDNTNEVLAPLRTRAFAVLGPFRGGTSVTCGVLQRLGVYVGSHFWNAKSNYCTYEAMGLLAAANKCFGERPHQWRYYGSQQQRVLRLKRWMDRARWTAAETGCVGVGGKHPTLCKLVDETAQAWKSPNGIPPLFIAVIRPLDQVLAGWTRATEATGWWDRPDRDRIVADLIESRDQALRNHEHIRVDFQELRERPEQTIARLAAQCGLPLTNLQHAVDLIQR